MTISTKVDPGFSIPYNELISIQGEIQSKTKAQQFYYVDEMPTILMPYIDTFLYGKTIGEKGGRKIIINGSSATTTWSTNSVSKSRKQDEIYRSNNSIWRDKEY